jgi:nitroreductase
MLRAVTRVPDFQHLQPYRFLIARDEGLTRLGEAMQRAAIRLGKTAEVVERAKRMPHRAPLVVVVISSPKPSDVVTTLEQQLCAGCAALTLQLAANSLGYAGVWRTGWLASEPTFHEELHLTAGETIVGFLYLGTTPKGCDSGQSISVENSPLPDTAWI